MSTVVDLMAFRERGRSIPTLVLVDLHQELLDVFAMGGGSSGSSEAIENCRVALNHARACGLPVAFTRRVAKTTAFGSSPNYPRWLKGFEPHRSDMVFDRSRPSCYSSPEFEEMAEYLNGNYVVAGQFAELSCLSTAVDAFHRDHKPTFLYDALASRAYDGAPAELTDRTVSQIISLYADIETTSAWTRATTRRVRVRE